MAGRHLARLMLVLLLPGVGLGPTWAQAPEVEPPYYMQEGPRPDAGIKLTYWIGMPRPNTHNLEIKILAEGAKSETLDFSMPAWSPGRYIVYDFAKHVKNVRATGKGGAPLAIRRIDKDTWRVAARGGDCLLSYTLYANHLSGTFSQVNADYASINGAATFMYVDGKRHAPITLYVDPPAEKKWEVVSPLPPADAPGRYLAEDYDHLIDSPCLVGKFERFRFVVAEKPIYVIVNQAAPSPYLDGLVDNLKKIVAAGAEMFGGLPFENYFFFYHFGRGPGEGDGMEHRNSTQITFTAPLADSTSVASATSIGAHEFFHAWNVKRIRPEELGPFDLTKETYTRSLWIAEGLTRYYQFMLQLRAGTMTRAEFRRAMADNIATLESKPGRLVTSAEESSFLTWFWRRDGEDSDESNTDISYYNKGCVLGFLLDLELRASTRGERGLDDVFRKLMKDFFAKGKGYKTEDFYDACSSVAGRLMDDFFRDYAAGVEPLPYAKIAEPFGILIGDGALPPSAFLGISLDQQRITGIETGAPAAISGLQKGDWIEAIGGKKFHGDLSAALSDFSPGAKAPITVQRNGAAQSFLVTFGARRPARWVVDEKPDVDEDVQKLRDAFYTGRRN